MNLVETVYKDRSNPNDVLFYEDGAALDFSAATRVMCKLYSNKGELVATVDSSASPVLISWTDTSVSPNVLNVITFNLNSLNLSGLHRAIVVVYDASHTDGQVLAHPDGLSKLLFNFVNA